MHKEQLILGKMSHYAYISLLTCTYSNFSACFSAIRDPCKTYLPGVTKATPVYGTGSNCYTLANKENKVVFLQDIITFMLCIIFKCKKNDCLSKYAELLSYYF